MNQPAGKKYPAAFKERAVKLAVESEQAIAQTARDLGVNENTLHTSKTNISTKNSSACARKTRA